ncbi:GNAT family N-acetyltransferase [Kordiimonas sp. SCSIO 12603]|uniref:GNAT family N-acetyltransferase n=1 Tax=Kordiimonas sp. SCSIO 12603 TaxID=2829596 RepID=UPI00210775CC|nr:GNAT family N-acetyltransferase [Kordiimonas sp. SCSIO 12603]UTW59822.1 GNAT family N-acetyltransferase [Kordiimonas sp. SCSIO 12603]
MLNDLEAFHAQLNDPLVARNSSTIPHPVTLDFAKERLISRGRDERLLFNMFQRGIYDGDVLVGSGVLFINPKDEWEIGYFIGADHRGKGYATEAAKALLKLAQQLEPRRAITARFGKDNPASGRVLQKIGFVFDSEEMVNSISRGASYLSVKVRYPKEVEPDGIMLTSFETLADIEWVYSLNEDPEALLMAGIAGEVIDKASFVKAMQDDLADPQSNTYMFLIRKNGERAGYIDLSPAQGGKVALGYWIDRKFWGQGIAGRAVAMLLQAQPDVMRRQPLFARVLDGNEASIRILEKLGFETIGRNSYYSGPHKGNVQQTIFRR